jgi:toxin FitB
MKTSKARSKTKSRSWQLQTAKAQFSEVFRRARSEGPQYVTRGGKEAVVIVPTEEFNRLTVRARQPQSLVEFFARSPLAEVELNLEREPDYGRNVELWGSCRQLGEQKSDPVSGFLLDTNVVSELVRPKPNLSVARWVEATDEGLLYLSVLTLGEIRKGITLLADSARRVKLEAWLDGSLVARFAGRILPVDQAVADRWGRLAGSGSARKSPLPVIDGLLAATALDYDLVLVTRDTAHLKATGVAFFNPWESWFDPERIIRNAPVIRENGDC